MIERFVPLGFSEPVAPYGSVLGFENVSGLSGISYGYCFPLVEDVGEYTFFNYIEGRYLSPRFEIKNRALWPVMRAFRTDPQFYWLDFPLRLAEDFVPLRTRPVPTVVAPEVFDVETPDGTMDPETGEYPVRVVGRVSQSREGGPICDQVSIPLDESMDDLRAAEWQFAEAFVPGVGVHAELAIEDESVKVRKLRYRLQTRPGFSGTLTWFETFTPAGETAPRDYRFMSVGVVPGQQETGIYEIDPLERDNPHRFPGVAGTYAVQVFSIGLAVDANRDGEIKLDGSDETTADRPFGFWVNDDDDMTAIRTWTSGSTYTEREQDDGVVSDDMDKDCSNLVIDNERDLEDFARLWVVVTGLGDTLISGHLRVALQWSGVINGTPAIRLFRAVDADGGNRYLFDPSVASLQVDQLAASGAHGFAIGGVVDGANSVTLPSTIFDNRSDGHLETYLLFEGARSGNGCLKWVILDANEHVVGQAPGIWLDLKLPHELVERYTCGGRSIAEVETLTHFTPSATFGPPTTEEEQDYLLYVHGYNMDDPEKQRWIETTFKRLFWLGYRGRVGGFSWPCAFGPIDQVRFDESEERAWQAGARLLEHLQNLKNSGYRVHVVAHSQGNVVMGEALRGWRAAGNASSLVYTYIASQAALAAHCYNSAAPLMPDYNQATPNVYAVYWRAGDSARFPQTWPSTNPSYFADSIMRSTVGRWVNFYNPQDFALTAANGGIGSWESDQRLKPNNLYAWSPSRGFFKGVVPFDTMYEFPGDRFQVFSFCAAARSVALGADATGGVFSDAIDLRTFGFSGEHLWHSGQFRSFIASRHQYWAEVLRTIGIQPYTP